MSNQTILDYVDSVMTNIDVPNDQKVQIENELIRYIMKATENTSVEEVKNSLCSPEKLAQELMKNPALSYKENTEEELRHRRAHHHQRYAGEFMQERSNVNLKLLYIPLIQISSGTQRIIKPLFEDEDDD